MFRAYIDGQFVQTEHSFPIYEPARGRVYETAALCGQDEVDRAVAAARRALKGPWAQLPVEQRVHLLRQAADRIDARAAEFIEAEVRDTGKPISFASRVDVPRGAANLRFFADLVRVSGTQSWVTDTPDGQGAIQYALRQPVGVVAVVCPWNLPLLLLTWKLGPALALGNTVVVKPSEETPATATLLAEVFHEVGLPPGVFNLVHGFGADAAGEALVSHPDVNAVTFTGESRTGSAIMARCAPHVRPVSFELGGKNASVVFEDADMDVAVAGNLRSVFSNCGQVCLCSERVLVHRSRFDEFVSRLAEGARSLRMGDPMNHDTGMGSLISANHLSKVDALVQQGVLNGEVICGARRGTPGGDFDRGYFYEPTILTGLPDTHPFVREEVFGPVCHVAPFDDEDEAVQRANDSPYGLCAAVWTTRLDRAHRVSANLHAGVVWVNSWFLRDLRTPFGGAGISGIGREGGQHSLDFYSELKTICIKL